MATIIRFVEAGNWRTCRKTLRARREPTMNSAHIIMALHRKVTGSPNTLLPRTYAKKIPSLIEQRLLPNQLVRKYMFLIGCPTSLDAILWLVVKSHLSTMATATKVHPYCQNNLLTMAK